MTAVNLYRVTTETVGREVYEIAAIDGVHAQKYVEDGDAGEPKISEVITSSVEHVELIAEELSDIEARKLGPFIKGAQTSRNATLDTYPRQGSQRARILAVLDIDGPKTREALALRLHLSENTIRPRVKELIEGGWIEATGKVRKTTRGSDAELLALTDRGVAAMSERASGSVDEARVR